MIPSWTADDPGESNEKLFESLPVPLKRYFFKIVGMKKLHYPRYKWPML
jgi:hypothetical protein